MKYLILLLVIVCFKYLSVKEGFWWKKRMRRMKQRMRERKNRWKTYIPNPGTITDTRGPTYLHKYVVSRRLNTNIHNDQIKTVSSTETINLY